MIERQPERRVSPAITEWQTFVEPLMDRIKELEKEVKTLRLLLDISQGKEET